MKVKLSLNQVRDGFEYKGCLKVGEADFLFTLRFDVHIKELDNLPPPPVGVDECLKYAQKLYAIVLEKDGKPIEQDVLLFGFLLQAVVQSAIEFYNLGQTRDANEGFMGMMLEGTHFATRALGSKVEIGTECSYEIPEESIPVQLLR